MSILLGGGQVDQGPEPGDEVVGPAGRQPGHGAGQVVHAEHLAVTAQRFMAGRGQPDQRPAPVGRIVLPLQQALVFQVRHDLADHRLRSGHVRRGLTHGERTRQRQVLEYGAGGTGQLAPGPVPPVKRQVYGPEELREPFGLRSLLGHGTRVAAGESIVNPDGFPSR